ncbi:histone methyltransferase set2 [Geranomyces michiganensis]|nr:histone methyltransferase set2 [Geranomyces michiganensis]
MLESAQEDFGSTRMDMDKGIPLSTGRSRRSIVVDDVMARRNFANLDMAPQAPKQSWEKPVCDSPDVYERVIKTYTHIMQNECRGAANGRTMTEEYMTCECRYVPGGDMRRQACGDEANCINRELFIECSACPAGQFCQNRKFQTRDYAPIEVFETEKKGFGLRATAPIPSGSFVIEYCGEVITAAMFKKRTQEYDKDGVKHFYFMSLKSNEYLDAAKKGNMSRFMNHSCDPNCALHKWIVGDSWRIGMFTLTDIEVGQELTFDYKFKRYGAKAQPCYCGSSNCSGFIGGKQAEMALRPGDEDSDDENLDDDSRPARRIIQRRGEDSDYEGGEIGIRRGTRVVRDIEDIKKLVRAFMGHMKKPRRVENLLSDLEDLDPTFQRRFIWVHGLTVLKWCLEEYNGKDNQICLHALKVLQMLPISTRNEGVEACVLKVTEQPDVECSNLAKELMHKWSTLEKAYKIPKRLSAPQAPKDVPKPPNGNGVTKRPFDGLLAEPNGSPTKRYRRDFSVIEDEPRTPLEPFMTKSEGYRAAPVAVSGERMAEVERPMEDRSTMWPRSRSDLNNSRRSSNGHYPYEERVPPAAFRDPHSDRNYSDRGHPDHRYLEHMHSERIHPSRVHPDRIRHERVEPDHGRHDRVDPDYGRHERMEPDYGRHERGEEPDYGRHSRMHSDRFDHGEPAYEDRTERKSREYSDYSAAKEQRHSVDDNRPLPEGWFKAISPDGEPYYYDYAGTTTWDFPTSPSSALPDGHEPDEASTPAQASSTLRAGSSSSPYDDKPPTSHSSMLMHYPKRRKRELGDHVAKMLSNYEIPPGLFKDRAKQLTHALMDKELKSGRSQIRESLSDRSKQSITEYLKEWCTRHNFHRKKPKGRSKGEA